MRNLARAAFRQEQKSLFADRSLQRRAALFPIGKQFGQRNRVDDGARQNVRADLRTLFKHANADFAPAARGQLLQPDSSGQTSRPAADDDDVVLHRFALHVRVGHGSS